MGAARKGHSSEDTMDPNAQTPVEGAATVTPTEAPTTPATAPTAAVEAPAATFTQEDVNRIVAERLARKDASSTAAAKTEADRIAALEERATKAESAALAATVAKAAAATHAPDLVAKLVDLEGVSSDDPAAVEAKVAELLAAHPWLVKAEAVKPNTTPAPGAGAASADAGLMSEEELRQVNPARLATDPKLRERFAASRKALGV